MKNCRNCGAPPTRGPACLYCRTYTGPVPLEVVGPTSFVVPDKVIVDYVLGGSGVPRFTLGRGGTVADLIRAQESWRQAMYGPLVARPTPGQKMLA